MQLQRKAEYRYPVAAAVCRKRLAGPAPQLQIVLCSAASGEPAIPPVQPSIAQQSSSTALSQQQDGQQEQQQILTKLPEAVFSIVQQHDLQVQIVKVVVPSFQHICNLQLTGCLHLISPR